MYSPLLGLLSKQLTVVLSQYKLTCAKPLCDCAFCRFRATCWGVRPLNRARGKRSSRAGVQSAFWKGDHRSYRSNNFTPVSIDKSSLISSACYCWDYTSKRWHSKSASIFPIQTTCSQRIGQSTLKPTQVKISKRNKRKECRNPAYVGSACTRLQSTAGTERRVVYRFCAGKAKALK